MAHGNTGRPGVNPNLVLAILCVAGFMASLDAFIVNVAFESIHHAFSDRSMADVSWVLNGYLIVYAALLVPFGRLADRVGRKRVFIFGILVFTVASALCAWSPSFWLLVAFRAMQALGAAAMTPTSLGLLLTMMPPERRASAVRTWAATSGLAAAAGPIVGGLLVNAGWEWIFLVNVPVGLAAAVVATLVLREFQQSGTRFPDVLGALLVAVATAGLVYGLIEGPDLGWGNGWVVTGFGLFVVLGAFFYWRNNRHPAAVIPMSLFETHSFRWANFAAILFNIGFGGAMLAIVLWMQQVWGYSALKTGMAIFLGPLMVPVFAAVAQRLSSRMRSGAIVAIGCLIVGVTAAAMAVLTDRAPDGVAAIIATWAVMGIGVGLALPTILSSATSELAPQLAATGSAVSNMSRQLGMSVGVAILVAILGSSVSGDQGTRFSISWAVIAVFSAVSALAAMGMNKRRVVAKAGQVTAPVTAR